MPIPVSDIIQRVGIVLNDEAHARWKLTELFAWINDAACEIVIRRPASRAIVGALTLVEGVLQSLPNNGLQVLDVVRNLPGSAISRVKRQLLDDQNPDWYAMRAKPTKHYTLEEETPRHFYVYPPAVAGAQVEVKYSAAPPEITDIANVVDLDRAYMSPIISFVLYRAMAKDSEYANGQVAITHFQAFSEAVAIQNATTAASTNTAGTQ